ncbi:hypothetical protein [Streptomyces phytophilus]|uniref:hypothetical protein n=1 Tax=Streptomyces phytophilus TaxID=722715 RepID=UPI00215DA22C|nr:hypothetical protein [Streptomyces phytophilus]
MRVWARVAVAMVAAPAGVGLQGGVAAADEHYNGGTVSNGSSFALLRTGQIDDPMEDVLEHTLLFGGEHTWD